MPSLDLNELKQNEATQTHEQVLTIICTNFGILSIEPLDTNGEILIEIQTFSLKKIRLKMLSTKFCPFRLGLNVLRKRMCNEAWNAYFGSLKRVVAEDS